eukprot:Sspe_Gene.16748::Locus_5913_Transcript_1_1_Confidence_1.000_Length_1742::g.16748::m.16748/K14994/SLC38A7_8; solute carrier family 38 (sodium-coupled neutral amino acid transporter), member 7/8
MPRQSGGALIQENGEDATCHTQLVPKDEESGSDVPEGGRGGFFTSVFTVFNSTVGTGILTLPYSLSMSGAGFGLMTIFFYALVMGCSAYAVVRTADRSGGASTFQQVVHDILGPRAGKALSLIISLYCYLVCVGCLVIVADVAHPLVKHFAGAGHDNAWYAHRQLHILLGAVVALPPMCLRDFTSLAFTAFLSFSAVVFVVCVVVAKGATSVSEDYTAAPLAYSPLDSYGEIRWWPVDYKFLYAIPNIALSLQCHIQAPGIYAEVAPGKKSTKFFAYVLLVAYFLCVSLYCTCAFFGYATFRLHTPANIMQAGYSDGDVSIIIARICLLVTAICAVPINHHPCRTALRDLLVKLPLPEGEYEAQQPQRKSVMSGQSTGSRRRSSLSASLVAANVDNNGPMPADRFFYAETGTFWVLFVAVAMVVPNLAVLNDIAGFTAGVGVMFIFPGLFLVGIKQGLDTAKESNPRLYNGIGWGFVAFGVATGIIAAFSFFDSTFG